MPRMGHESRIQPLTALTAGMPIVVGGDRVVHVGEELAAADRLLPSEIGQVDVDPARELVGCVPRGLPVTQEDESSVSHKAIMTRVRRTTVQT